MTGEEATPSSVSEDNRSNLFLPSHLGELPIGGEAVTLYDGPMVLHHGKSQIAGEGKVAFRLMPDLDVRFIMRSDEMLSGLVVSGDDDDPAVTKTLEMVSTGRRTQVILTGATVSSSPGQSSAHGKLVGNVQFAAEKPDGKPESIGRVRFHLVNLREFWGERLQGPQPASGSKPWLGRTRFTFNQWIVTIDALPKIGERWEHLEARGGCAFTHIGDLRRRDAELFASPEAADVMGFLSLFLSFVNGACCGCVLAAGYRHLDCNLWEQWTPYIADTGKPGKNWFPAHLPDEGLTIAERAYALWQDKGKREWLTLAIRLYTNSNTNTSGSEMELAQAQIALELLCWVMLREEQTILSEDGMEKLTAADRIRLLLSWSGIPLTIPSTLKKLTSAFAGVSGADGPSAVTEIRNRIVHPTKKNLAKLEEYDRLARFEAWQLTQWYVEMVMLKLFGYHGRYSNRLDFKFGAGAYEKVPWSAEANSPK